MTKILKYLETLDKRDCCSCGSCAQACPIGCIEMKDVMGVHYPQLDAGKCLHCGKCAAACQYSEEHFRYSANMEGRVYACWHRNREVVKTSSSGGFFTAVSDCILEQGGVVFGAGFQEDFTVAIVGVESKAGRDRLKGSKYVKSDTQDSYRRTRDFLDSGKQVLYTGTPCQVAGLNAFLAKSYDNLICVDLICHGMLSAVLFDEYLKELETQYRAKLVDVKFRYKKCDGSQCFRAEMGNSQVHMEGCSEKYGHVLGSHLAQMPACTTCLYNKFERESDLTMGDFWGIEGMSPEHANDIGTSLVIINTEKGRRIFDALGSNLVSFSETKAHALQSNPPLSRNCGYNPLSKSFLPYLKKHGFGKAYFWYAKLGDKLILPYRLARKIKRVLTR